MDGELLREAILAHVRNGQEETPIGLADRTRYARDRRLSRALRPFKVCPKCGEHLPARAFAGDEKRPDGLQSECRSCRKRPIL